MEIEGRLIVPNDLCDEATSLKDVKELYLYILTSDDSYKKLRNIDKTYSVTKLPINRIPSCLGLTGYRITVRTRNITGKIGKNMLSMERKNWENKVFSVKFKISKYKFTSKLPHNDGQIICGANFVLEYIDMII